MDRAERLRLPLPRNRTGLLAATFLALVCSPASKAFAQDTTPSYTESRGFQTYQPPSGDASFLNLQSDSFRIRNVGVDTSANVRTAPAEHPEPSASANSDTEAIVVTGRRIERFEVTPNPESDDGIFERMGVESTRNPDLEGLAFLTPEEMRDNGWAVSVPMLGSRRGETGPFVSFEAGRERIIAGGIRF